MNLRSISLAALMALFVAGTASAQGQLQAVPRAGVAFTNTVTVRAKVETIDSESRTIIFTRPDGRQINVPVAADVDLEAVQDEANVDITYKQIVTLLNLRQKGPGSQVARREGEQPRDQGDIDMGRFTVTVVAVDLPNNKVSVVQGTGGAVRTIAATSVAQKDAISKIKVGDVIIGMTTPLTVTRIVAVK